MIEEIFVCLENIRLKFREFALAMIERLNVRYYKSINPKDNSVSYLKIEGDPPYIFKLKNGKWENTYSIFIEMKLNDEIITRLTSKQIETIVMVEELKQ